MDKKKNIYERYSRQIVLKEFGIEAQQKLLNARVLVIGAGGLGCASLQYLAAAGIGTLGIIDDDVVTLNNLQRQVLYGTNDLGKFKAATAKEKLQNINPDLNYISYIERMTTENAIRILSLYDIIIDGTDNFASRYLINDACVLLKKPLVYGAVSRYEGQVALFNTQQNASDISINYRDLFPEPPKDSDILNCEQAGVLGVLPGIIGILQASETIKLLTSIGKVMANSILTFNVLTNEIYEISVSPNEKSTLLIPQTEEEFMQTNYSGFCHSAIMDFEIDPEIFDQMLSFRGKESIQLIDVREPGETPELKEFQYLQIPLSQIAERAIEIKADKLILFCQSGRRSLIAAQQLSEIFSENKTIYSLRGGIMNWLKISKHQSL